MLPLLLAFCLVLPVQRTEAAETPAADAPPDVVEAPDRAEAIARFQKFIEEHPDRPEIAAARFRLAALLLEDGEGPPSAEERAEATRQLEGALADAAAGRAEGFAQGAEAWYLLGACRQESDPAGAAAAWEQVVALAPGTPLAASANLGLGQFALEAEDWAGAASRFDAARGIDRALPTWSQATYLCGWSRYRAQDYPGAIAPLVELLGQDDTAAAALQPEALATLAFALVDAAGEGGSVAGGVGEVLPGLPEARRGELIEQVAALLEQLGRFDEAGDVRKAGGRRRGRGRGQGSFDRGAQQLGG
jgi:tetratricopeptide (TPR) repeat protein